MAEFNMLLFDLDGTLTDPKEGITKSVAYALQHFGKEVDPEQLIGFIGPPLKDSFMSYAKMSEEQAKLAIQKYRERFSTVGLFENHLYEGVCDMLKSLKRQGKKLAIATSKPQCFAEQILQHYHVAEYFDWVVGSELDGRRSKKSEVIEEVLRQAEIKLEERKSCLMIGDRKHDIEGAKACNIASLGLRLGYAEEGELEQAGADFIVDDIQQLQAFLQITNKE